MMIKSIIKRIYIYINRILAFPPKLSNALLRFFSFNQNFREFVRLSHCPLCGKFTFMVVRGKDLRETGECLNCRANSRYKAMSELLKRAILIKLSFPNIDSLKLKKLLRKFDLTIYSLQEILEYTNSKNFSIYEPSSTGSMFNALKKYDNFLKSEFFPNPNLKPGEIFKGIRFENLQNLTFKENSFDIIITLDVFEHVQNPEQAFKEIFRVLKPGGIHLFTVPIENRQETLKRIDINNNILIKPMIYHSDAVRSKGPIVYTDWGYDIIDFLKKLKIPSFIFKIEGDSIGIFCEVNIFVSVKE